MPGVYPNNGNCDHEGGRVICDILTYEHPKMGTGFRPPPDQSIRPLDRAKERPAFIAW